MAHSGKHSQSGATALPGVGVMGMLRFARFTGGQFWIGDYGDQGKEADFRNLLSYSPYDTIRSGTPYPAILVTTADTDDRAVPAHSFKYVAALQAAKLGDEPRILRVDRRTGHGAGKPKGRRSTRSPTLGRSPRIGPAFTLRRR